MKKLIVSSAPHIHCGETVQGIMLDVLVALAPATLAGVYFFGLKALMLYTVCIAVCVVTEWLYQRICGFKITIKDLSAIVTGLLLAMVLPPQTPWWVAAIGGFVSIFVAKQVFGGIGYNIFNPALVGRAFLLASWPVYLTSWSEPAKLMSGNWFSLTDAVSTATPLTLAKNGEYTTKLADLFFGNVGGCVGETSAIALLLGAAYLFYRGHISWHIPLPYVGTVALLTWVMGENGVFTGHPLFHVLAGGLILGAFFMATDMVTSPVTGRGKVIFGIGAGILVVLIRKFGGYPEGVCYSILLMNAAVPLIDRLCIARRFGEVRA
ncbi:MAG: RnfABCDGE type electron transport complex subunit D [Candidatus Wallbacteria bacterium]|nr:RnfABCDGE type electron transport complex subunit D [Candidatus Wallbacteria bacterium]